MFEISESTKEFIQKEMNRYETKRSAIIPSLFRVQKDNGGWVSPECVTALSEFMDIPSSWIKEVLNFYTMFNTKPVGKLHVQVCTNISCAMNGGRELTHHLCQKYKVSLEKSALMVLSLSPRWNAWPPVTQPL